MRTAIALALLLVFFARHGLFLLNCVSAFGYTGLMRGRVMSHEAFFLLHYATIGCDEQAAARFIIHVDTEESHAIDALSKQTLSQEQSTDKGY